MTFLPTPILGSLFRILNRILGSWAIRKSIRCLTFVGDCIFFSNTFCPAPGRFSVISGGALEGLPRYVDFSCSRCGEG